MIINIKDHPKILKELRKFTTKKHWYSSPAPSEEELQNSLLASLIKVTEEPALYLRNTDEWSVSVKMTIMATKISVLTWLVKSVDCMVNNLGDKVVDLAKIVASPESPVTRLSVRCEQVGKYYEEFFAVLVGSKIVSLDISHNSLGALGPVVVCECGKLPKLTELNISGNIFEKAVSETFLSALGLSKCGVREVLMRNSFSETDKVKIREAIKIYRKDQELLSFSELKEELEGVEPFN